MLQALNRIPGTCRIPPACRERFLPLRNAALAPLRDMGVVMAGISDLCPRYEMGRPDPPHHVILYTMAGSATLVTPHRRRTLTPGTLWSGAAHHPHHYFVSKSWRILWFHFDAASPWMVPDDDQDPVRPAARFAPLPAFFEKCVDESLLDEPYAQDIARACAEVIALCLARALSSREGPAARRVRHELQVLWGKVNANLQHNWTVAEFARELRSSHVQCHRLVAKYHHATPMGMVTRLRMQRAEELLRHTDYPVYLIAGMIGYQTPFSFSRAFKHHAGQSPKRFRLGMVQ